MSIYLSVSGKTRLSLDDRVSPSINPYISVFIHLFYKLGELGKGDQFCYVFKVKISR